MNAPATMTVDVLLFAGLAASVGQRKLSLNVPIGATVADVLALLSASHPPIAAMADRLAMAVSHDYVEPCHVLKAGDELALIPPVSGG
jgi:molybdopterin synthase catalytic subunit